MSLKEQTDIDNLRNKLSCYILQHETTEQMSSAEKKSKPIYEETTRMPWRMYFTIVAICVCFHPYEDGW